MQLGSPNLTKTCSTVIRGNPFILGSKGQRSRSHCLCPVFRHYAMLPVYIRKPGFPSVTSPRPLAGCICKPRGFFPRAGLCTLVNAGFFSLVLRWTTMFEYRGPTVTVTNQPVRPARVPAIGWWHWFLAGKVTGGLASDRLYVTDTHVTCGPSGLWLGAEHLTFTALWDMWRWCSMDQNGSGTSRSAKEDVVVRC